MIGSFLLAVVGSATSSTDPKTVGDLFHAGETAAWVFESDQGRIGYHTSRYVGVDDLAGVKAHHFQGAYRLKGAVEVRTTGDLWTDDHGHPIRFVQQALAGDAYSRVDLDVAGAKSKARIQQGSSTREISLDIDPSAYLLANNYISHLEIVLALQPEGATQKLKLFSGNTLQGLEYTLTPKGTYIIDFDDGSAEHGRTYADSLGEELSFATMVYPTKPNALSRLIKVEIKPAKLIIQRTTEGFEPITITPPALRKASVEFDTEEVKVSHGDVVIAGSVTKKKGAKARLPAVFFISGSGPEDRDGFSSGIDLGTHELLDHLTKRGYLVLRVDDRGAGATVAPSPDPSYLDFLADARACVEFLEKRDDVDPKRIALIGHSEGGETAPILAAERAGIAAIVLMAAPGRPLLDVVMDQNRLALEKQGLANDEIEKQLVGVRAFLMRLVGDEPIDPKSLTTAEERTALASRKWMQSHAKHDPIATIKQVKCPVLILQGAKDFQVSPVKDAAALEAALKDAQHPDHELHVLDGLDHLFKKTPGDKSELGDYWKNRPIDTSFLDALDVWLDKRMKPAGG